MRHYNDNHEHIASELERIGALIQNEFTYRTQNVPEMKPGETQQNPGMILNMLNPSIIKGKKDDNHYSDYKQKYTENQQRIQKTVQHGISLRLLHLANDFNLSVQEIEILLVCVYAHSTTISRPVFQIFNGDINSHAPTVNTIIELLFSPEEQIKARSYFIPTAPLFANNILQFIEPDKRLDIARTNRQLRLADRVADYLFGHEYVDDRIAPFARLVAADTTLDDLVVPKEAKEELNQFATWHANQDADEKPFVCNIHGIPGTGKKTIARAVCNGKHNGLLVIDTRTLVHAGQNIQNMLTTLHRDSILARAALYFEHFDNLTRIDDSSYLQEQVVFDLAQTARVPVFLGTEQPIAGKHIYPGKRYKIIQCIIPDYTHAEELWQKAAANNSNNQNYAFAAGTGFTAIAAQYTMTGDQVQNALYHADNTAFWKSPDEGSTEIAEYDLIASCKGQSSDKLIRFAQKRTPGYTYDELVLPENQKKKLKEIAERRRDYDTVYKGYGFDSTVKNGKGIVALFHGESGTGKTMAADIIANEVGQDLYIINLAHIISKYVGETEKNLDQIFKDAENSNAILFFDEADALFGKRTAVKESHDRYANIEVGYLLQKMEQYQGVVILATNLKRNMDEAFRRRIHAQVTFPKPNDTARLQIWKGMFPQTAPLDENIDWEFLSKEIPVSGGNIKNMVIDAAFLAAANNKPISMTHIMPAIQKEFEKIGITFSVKREFVDYYRMARGIPVEETTA